MNNMPKIQSQWPELQYESWKDTLKTLHMWLQIVGKIRLTKSPWTNHTWHSTFYVTERGLSTSIIHDQELSFSIEFNFQSHLLQMDCSNRKSILLPLQSESVASFYKRCLETLSYLGIQAEIVESPNEVIDAIPFSKDQTHHSYDPEYTNRFWLVLLQAHRVMEEFRSHFSGKVSPVHFFWGSLDLAVTRFSGRTAPEHPGGVPHLPDVVTRDAYSHEVSSCGFWPGNDGFPTPAFYSYAYPIPKGFEHTQVPKGAYYQEKLREFILPYDVVRNSPSPDELILKFFQSTYEAAVHLGKWDRTALEESPYLKILQEKYNKRHFRSAA